MIAYICVSALLAVLLSAIHVESAVFDIPSGNVTALIAAINEANANGQGNTVNLEPGTYTLTAVDHGTFDSATGLPAIASPMTLNGADAATTVIERDPAAPSFRIMSISGSGQVSINGLTIRGGRSAPIGGIGGAGIRNAGTLIINRSIIEENGGAQAAGGIRNQGDLTVSETLFLNNNALFHGGAILNNATATIIDSTFSSNFSQGAIIENLSGSVTLQNSTITKNRVDFLVVFNGGTMKIVNSTLANNTSRFGFDGTVVNNSGSVEITNSTIVGNVNLVTRQGGGVTNVQGSMILQNTIVAGNGDLGDCKGSITSLGNNIIGNPAGCEASLLPTDMTGEPGLGEFTDDGTPGNGHFPLLEGSPAIGAGNSDACPETDQLGQPRRGTCDIGAIEFQISEAPRVVSINIAPDDKHNKINLKTSKPISVAILSRPGFDATRVDRATVRFGVTGLEAAPLRMTRPYVNRDRRRDALLQFSIRQAGITCGDTLVIMTGQTFAGESFTGSGRIKTLGCK